MDVRVKTQAVVKRSDYALVRFRARRFLQSLDASPSLTTDQVARSGLPTSVVLVMLLPSVRVHLMMYVDDARVGGKIPAGIHRYVDVEGAAAVQAQYVYLSTMQSKRAKTESKYTEAFNLPSADWMVVLGLDHVAPT